MQLSRSLALLARAPCLDAGLCRAAANAHGDIASLPTLSKRTLSGLGFHVNTVEWLAAVDRTLIDDDLRWLERSDARLLACTDADYPARLLDTRGAPPVLYLRGNSAALSVPQIAIVGSRNPTANGRAVAHEFAQYFAECGIGVTSGLALGIDGAAHAGALAGDGCTVAVCGTGLDRVYPDAHRALAERIVASGGALIGEFPPGTPPLPGNFPQRNRLISALSLGTLVVEAAPRSGSLSTAKHAAGQGRDVFAIPGSIHSPQSMGCHQLIREGARLVTSAAEVLAELKLPLAASLLTKNIVPNHGVETSPARSGLDKEYEILLDALGFEPTTIDVLVARTGLSTESIASMLLLLELDGCIEPHPGGRYSCVRRSTP